MDKDSKVVYLRSRRRSRGHVRRKANLVSGHRATVIPFPTQVGTKLFTPDAGVKLNRRALARRKNSQARKPMLDSSGRDGTSRSDRGDDHSALPYRVGRYPFSEVHEAQGYYPYSKDTSGSVAPLDTGRNINLMTDQTWQHRALERMKKLNLIQADLMKPLGVKTRGAVGHYLSGRRPISALQMATLAQTLQMSIDELINGTRDGEISKTGPAPSVSDFDATAVHIPSEQFRRVPVVGTASLGMDGYWTDMDYPAGHGDGYFDFPTSDPGAYVVRVKGGSMHPAIRSGWFVEVNPNEAIQSGEFVLLRLVDGRSTVKEFLWHRDGEYVLNAVSDGQRLVIHESDVEYVHAVGGILPPSARRL